MDTELRVCVCASVLEGSQVADVVREPGEWREVKRPACGTGVCSGQERALCGSKTGGVGMGPRQLGLGWTEVRVQVGGSLCVLTLWGT